MSSILSLAIVVLLAATSIEARPGAVCSSSSPITKVASIDLGVEATRQTGYLANPAADSRGHMYYSLQVHGTTKENYLNTIVALNVTSQRVLYTVDVTRQGENLSIRGTEDGYVIFWCFACTTDFTTDIMVADPDGGVNKLMTIQSGNFYINAAIGERIYFSYYPGSRQTIGSFNVRTKKILPREWWMKLNSANTYNKSVSVRFVGSGADTNQLMLTIYHAQNDVRSRVTLLDAISNRTIAIYSYGVYLGSDSHFYWMGLCENTHKSPSNDNHCSAAGVELQWYDKKTLARAGRVWCPEVGSAGLTAQQGALSVPITPVLSADGKQVTLLSSPGGLPPTVVVLVNISRDAQGTIVQSSEIPMSNVAQVTPIANSTVPGVLTFIDSNRSSAYTFRSFSYPGGLEIASAKVRNYSPSHKTFWKDHLCAGTETHRCTAILNQELQVVLKGNFTSKDEWSQHWAYSALQVVNITTAKTVFEMEFFPNTTKSTLSLGVLPDLNKFVVTNLTHAEVFQYQN